MYLSELLKIGTNILREKKIDSYQIRYRVNACKNC